MRRLARSPMLVLVLELVLELELVLAPVRVRVRVRVRLQVRVRVRSDRRLPQRRVRRKCGESGAVTATATAIAAHDDEGTGARAHLRCL